MNNEQKQKIEIVVIGLIICGSIITGGVINDHESIATQISENQHTLTTTSDSHEIRYNYAVDTDKELVVYQPNRCRLPKGTIIESIGENHLGTLYTVNVQKGVIDNQCNGSSLNVIADPQHMMSSGNMNRDWEDSVVIQNYHPEYRNAYLGDDKVILNKFTTSR